MVDPNLITAEEFESLASKEELIALMKKKKKSYTKVMRDLDYERQLRLLQIELVKLQRWIRKEKLRVAIIFEGRDAAGKGGTIRRFM